MKLKIFVLLAVCWFSTFQVQALNCADLVSLSLEEQVTQHTKKLKAQRFKIMEFLLEHGPNPTRRSLQALKDVYDEVKHPSHARASLNQDPFFQKISKSNTTKLIELVDSKLMPPLMATLFALYKEGEHFGTYTPREHINQVALALQIYVAEVALQRTLQSANTKDPLVRQQILSFVARSESPIYWRVPVDTKSLNRLNQHHVVFQAMSDFELQLATPPTGVLFQR